MKKQILLSLFVSLSGVLAAPLFANAYELDLDTSNSAFGTLVGEDSPVSYGFSHGVGDLNADGYDDFVISAYQDNDAGSDAGAVYVVYGSNTDIVNGQDLEEYDDAIKIVGENSGDYFGIAPTGSDINGDGYSDVVLNSSLGGDFYVIYGQEDRFTAGDVMSAADNVSRIGTNGSYPYPGDIQHTVGDVNGDSYDDIILPLTGYLVVVYGQSAVLTSEDVDGGTNTVSFLTTTPKAISSGMDLNGDGYDEIVVGLKRLTYDGASQAGAVYIIYGQETQLENENYTGFPTFTSVDIGGASADDRFGHAVNGLGDINNDGYDDLGVVAQLTDDGLTDGGSLIVIYGQSDHLEEGVYDSTDNTVTQLVSSIDLSNVRYVDGVSDLDGDGYDDFLVANSLQATNGSASGVLYILYGQEDIYTNNSDLSATTGAIRILGEDENYAVGAFSLNASGDFNSDGYVDLLISNEYNRVEELAGEAFILYMSPETIVLNSNDDETNIIECAIDEYSEPGATAVDSYDASSLTVATSGTVDNETTGTYTVTYSATNSIHLDSTATRTVTVEDTTDPTITLAGESAETITVGDSYTDAGATAADVCDGSLTEELESTSTVNTSVAGEYTVTYAVEDAAGNTATAIRTVNVEAAEVEESEGEEGEEESEVDSDEPVNDVESGDGDGSSDSQETLGAAIERERLNGGKVRVTYADGDTKVFQLFDINGMPKVQLHTNGDILIAINKKVMRTFNAYTGEKIDQVKLFNKKQAHTKMKRYNVYKKVAGQNNMVVLGRYKSTQKKKVNMRTFVVKNGGKIERRNIQRITLKNKTKFSKLSTSQNSKNGKKARIRLTRKGKVVQAYKFKITKKLGKSVLQ